MADNALALYGRGHSLVPVPAPAGEPRVRFLTGHDRLNLALPTMAHARPVAAPDPAAALAYALQQKDAFVLTLAHELRQPLAALQSAAGIVSAQAEDSASVAIAKGIMARQFTLMSRLIEDIVDAGRWTHGKLALRKQRLDLREIIRSAALDAAPVIRMHGHQLVVSTPPEPMWIDADRDRLHQVLSNLLGNAAKYTDPGGRIWLAAELVAANVTVRVRDSGRGIRADALGRVFDLYSQAGAAGDPGLGIGLTVVREIVASHGGSVSVTSEGLGHGAEFVVLLPVAAAQVSIDWNEAGQTGA